MYLVLTRRLPTSGSRVKAPVHPSDAPGSPHLAAACVCIHTANNGFYIRKRVERSQKTTIF